MSTTAIQNNKIIPRIDFIDALRGIAVLGVVMIHTFGILRLLGTHTASFVDWGSSGVKLFFTISSFTIFFSLKNRKENSLKGYFIRRFFRIAPLFYIVLITAFFISNSPNMEINNLLAKFIFIDNLNPRWVNNQIIGVEWTIGVEMIFYILAPFLFYKIKKLSTALIFLFITFCIPFFIFFTNFYPLSPEWQKYRAFSFFSHLYIFSIGVVVFFLYDKFQSTEEITQKKISNTCLFLLLALIALDFAGIEDRSKIISTIFNFNLQFILYFVLLFFASIKSYIRILWVNPLTIHMGKISYSVYLLHLIINILVIKNLSSLSPVYTTIISFILTIITSSITYKIIEKPFIKKGNEIAKKIATISK